VTEIFLDKTNLLQVRLYWSAKGQSGLAVSQTEGWKHSCELCCNLQGFDASFIQYYTLSRCEAKGLGALQIVLLLLLLLFMP